jgi:hypothetical protein
VAEEIMLLLLLLLLLLVVVQGMLQQRMGVQQQQQQQEPLLLLPTGPTDLQVMQLPRLWLPSGVHRSHPQEHQEEALQHKAVQQVQLKVVVVAVVCKRLQQLRQPWLDLGVKQVKLWQKKRRLNLPPKLQSKLQKKQMLLHTLPQLQAPHLSSLSLRHISSGSEVCLVEEGLLGLEAWYLMSGHGLPLQQKVLQQHLQQLQYLLLCHPRQMVPRWWRRRRRLLRGDEEKEKRKEGRGLRQRV